MRKIFFLLFYLTLISCSKDKKLDGMNGVYFFNNLEIDKQEYGYLEITDDSLYIFNVFNRDNYTSSIDDFEVKQNDSSKSIVLKDFKTKKNINLLKINNFRSLNIDITNGSWYTNKLGNSKVVDEAWIKFDKNTFNFLSRFKDEEELSQNIIDYQSGLLGSKLFIVAIPIWDGYYLVERSTDSLKFYSYYDNKKSSFTLLKNKEKIEELNFN